jgi:hypothetical protein
MSLVDASATPRVTSVYQADVDGLDAEAGKS